MGNVVCVLCIRVAALRFGTGNEVVKQSSAPVEVDPVLKFECFVKSSQKACEELDKKHEALVKYFEELSAHFDESLLSLRSLHVELRAWPEGDQLFEALSESDLAVIKHWSSVGIQSETPAVSVRALVAAHDSDFPLLQRLLLLQQQQEDPPS